MGVAQFPEHLLIPLFAFKKIHNSQNQHAYRLQAHKTGENFMPRHVDKAKRIALIAHDNMKKSLLEWCEQHREKLSRHNLCGTGTTSGLIRKETGLPVKSFLSGPLGGDQQIGASLAEGKLDMVIFFSDPLTAQPHDPDVKALLRIAQVYDVPIAMNRSSADFFISSPLFSEAYDYEPHIFDGRADKR